MASELSLLLLSYPVQKHTIHTIDTVSEHPSKLLDQAHICLFWILLGCIGSGLPTVVYETSLAALAYVMPLEPLCFLVVHRMTVAMPPKLIVSSPSVAYPSYDVNSIAVSADVRPPKGSKSGTAATMLKYKQFATSQLRKLSSCDSTMSSRNPSLFVLATPRSCRVY